MIWLRSALLLLLGGCASDAELARAVELGTRQQHLPKVVACWEREFERAGFRGSYFAVVALRIERGVVRSAKLSQLEDASDGGTAVGADSDLGKCILAALDGAELPELADYVELRIEGLRMAFVDATASARAQSDGQRLLIGPRADRCQGLYSYDPPREAQELAEELARAAAAGASGDADQRARELQRAWDVGLELIARLTLEIHREDLPEKSRSRFLAEIGRVKRTLGDVGPRIGCVAP